MVGTQELNTVARVADAAFDARNSVRAMQSSSSGLSAKDQIAQTGGMTIRGTKNISDTERHGAEVALKNELQQYQPNMIDKGLGITNGATGMFGMGALLGLPVIGAIGTGIGWVGEKTNLGFMKKTGAKLKAPSNYFKEATFADVGNKLGVSKPLGAATQGAADGMGWVAERIPGGKGFSAGRQTAAMGRAHSHLLKAQSHAAGMNISNLPEPVQALHAHVMLAEHPGQIGAVEFMRDAAEASKDGGVATAQKIKVTKPFAELTREAETALEGAKNLSRQEAKAAKKFLGSAGKMSDTLERAGMWKDVPGAIRSVPKNLATTNALHGDRKSVV